MKAIVCTEYGSPDVLQLKEVPRPTPDDDKVLVKVHAASLNAADLETLRGVFIVRIAAPRKPMYEILGSDIAGRVEAVGRNVKQFQPGDEVWGDLSYPHGLGAFAEYVCVSENALAPKPTSMTFEEAATYPQAAILALQSLCDKGQIQPGQKVLINGAGGGMGTFAVQLAKYFGAEVTGVDSTMKLDMLRSIGADHVIDYTKKLHQKRAELRPDSRCCGLSLGIRLQACFESRRDVHDGRRFSGHTCPGRIWGSFDLEARKQENRAQCVETKQEGGSGVFGRAFRGRQGRTGDR